jgi:hypothetical protein
MVSELIGEILKLAIVVMLVSMLAASLHTFVPEERTPYIETIVRYNESNSSIEIVHAGGDSLNSGVIMVSNETLMETHKIGVWRFPEKLVVKTNISPPLQVSIVHERAVLVRVEL